MVHSEGEEEPCPICQAQEARREVVITLKADDFNNPSGRPIAVARKMVRAVFRHQSNRKVPGAIVNHLAHHDALTDLPNRLLLNERREQAIKHAARHTSQLARIFLDLDHFKHINDSLGRCPIRPAGT